MTRVVNIKLGFKGVFVFRGSRLWPWPPALAFNLYLPVPVLNLYFPALAPNLYLTALVLNLSLPVLQFIISVYSVYLYKLSAYALAS